MLLPSLMHECSQKHVLSPAIGLAIAEAMAGVAWAEEQYAEHRAPRHGSSCQRNSERLYVWHLSPRVQTFRESRSRQDGFVGWKE